ncbi:DUF3224 domain-containing protein [Micromonospora echinospora]|uniref:DUF3224 domain-containing protein n=1 Tax=Micromonospora echinospora TaxID=1877 RepID=UPI003A886B5A
MRVRAVGAVDLIWDEQPPYDDRAGGRLARVVVTKEFQGDLQASSVAHLLKAESARPGSGGYVGLERVVGTLHGRPGSFVLQHCGVMDRGAGSLTIQVVPDTGTGELAGLTGTMEILLVDGERGFTFDYTVES